MIVNTEVDTLIESNLGTMIINDTDDDENDDAAAADNSDTMKRRFSLSARCFYSVCYVPFSRFPADLESHGSNLVREKSGNFVDGQGSSNLRDRCFFLLKQ